VCKIRVNFTPGILRGLACGKERCGTDERDELNHGRIMRDVP